MVKAETLHSIYSTVKVSLIVFLILFTVLILADYLVIYFYHPRILDINASILIIDVDGLLRSKVTNTSSVVVIHGMSVNDFRVLGESKAKVIVFVAHGLELANEGLLANGLSPGDYALETSENTSIWVSVSHLLMILTNSIVRGEIPGIPGEKVAVTRNIFLFSRPFNDKIIVLVTCGSPKIELFAKSFVDSGAKMVLYLKEYIDMRRVYELIHRITTLKGKDVSKVVEVLVDYGFNVMSS